MITASSVLLYFVFAHMRSSGDYTMLAGFRRDVAYEMTNFTKMVDSIAFYVLLSNFWTVFIFNVLLWCRVPRWLNAVLMLVYAAEILGVIVMLNGKYGDSVYQEKKRCSNIKSKKCPMRIPLYVLLYLLVTIVMLVCFYVYGLRNNTIEALKMVGILFADIAIVTGCLFYEVYRESEPNSQNKAIAKRAKIAFCIAAMASFVSSILLWAVAAQHL